MIAKSSNKRCVDRAVSTMRAALGYETALPKGWIYDTRWRHNKHVIKLFSRAFPDREVLVWCDKEHWETAGKLLNWRGNDITSGSEWDAYLFAFAYRVNNISHMVLGWPAASDDMKVNIIVAVKI